MSLSTRLFGSDAAVVGDFNFRLLLLTALLSPLGSGIVSPILDSLTGVYDVSPARIGLLVAAVTAPGIVFIPLAGRLSDRYGRKRVLVTGTFLFGVGGVAVTATTDFHTAIALRLLQGVGFSGVVPTLITSIGDMYDGEEEAVAQGLRFTAVGVAQVVFPFLAGVLVVVGWQYPFFLYGLAIPISVLLFFGLDEPSKSDRTVDAVGSDAGTPPVRDLLKLVVDVRVLSIIVARSIPSFVYVGFLAYNSILVVRILGESPSKAGILVAFGGLTFAVTASQVGRITRVFGTRYVSLLGAHASMAAGFTLLSFAPSFLVAVVGVFFGSFGFGITGSLYRSIVTGLVSERMRGGLVSVSESLGRLAATLSPILMGVAIEYSTPVVGFGLAVRGTVAGACLGLSLGAIGCVTVGRTRIGDR